LSHILICFTDYQRDAICCIVWKIGCR